MISLLPTESGVLHYHGVKIRSSGFSLLELLLTMAISSVILGAIVYLYMPLLTQFLQQKDFEKLRAKVSGPLDALTKEVHTAKSVVVRADDAQCYNLCIVDASGNRAYYFFSGSDFKRKSEATTTSLSCSSGAKAFAPGIAETNSLFANSSGLVSLGLYGTGINNTSYRLYTSAVRDGAERALLFYDGFECNHAGASGWVLNNNVLTAWTVQSSSSAIGRYWLREKLKTNTPAGSTATADLPLGIAAQRSTGLFLRFKYRTTGTMETGEKLSVKFSSDAGSNWAEVFKEELNRSISSLQTIVLDLTSHPLTNSNLIRFEGTLTKASDLWYIDDIEVFAK
jgi:prepilin-type N-terminal cleavage/methylation domain-containing protein